MGNDLQNTLNAKIITDKLAENIGKAIVGKNEVVKMVIAAFIAGGHILLEDVPGVGKTLLAKSIAKSINASFRRIQFTSDLLPSDITGVSIYNQKKLEFEYIEGPIFANIVLADEINRGTPRTQSSLLEAMEERQVSVDGIARQLPNPFFVIGTQNPIESHGTFPLPDSQVDRFMISISVGYPSADYEAEMLARHSKDKYLVSNVETVLSLEELIELQKMVYKVEASNEILQYIVKIASATRDNTDIMLGASPRSSVAMLTCAKAYALMNSRNYVIPDDIKAVAPYILAHRILTYRASSRKQVLELISNIMKKISPN
ncbi:MAG: MoxR family ATPase [Candidatus Sericytochromatia bacterium]|nr:MoxR family ATPase [Candidatus Sericytochromatia bacterium]